MMQLGKFARHKQDFGERKIHVVALSVDDIQQGRQVWEKSRTINLRSSAILARKSSASTVCCMQAAPMVPTLRSELRSLSPGPNTELPATYARAERKTCSSGPRPAQHPASLPSTTTAGTLRTP
jgi:hypothetical protein